MLGTLEQKKKNNYLVLIVLLVFILIILFFSKTKPPSLDSCTENKDGTLSGIYVGEFMTLRRTACINDHVVASYCVSGAHLNQTVMDCQYGCEYAKLGDEPMLSASCRKKPYEPADIKNGVKNNFLNITSAIGTNLSAISEDNTEFAFIDLMKRSTPCLPGSDSGQKQFDVDEYGYARSLLSGQVCNRTVLSSKAAEFLPSFFRNLVVLYTGKGTINYQGNVKVVSSELGRDVIEIGVYDVNKSDNGFGISITALPDKKDYIRDIHIVPLGGTCGSDIYTTYPSSSDCIGKFNSFESSFRNNPFVPEFLNKVIYLNGGLSKQKKPVSVIRFANWMSSGRKPESKLNWQNRAKLESSTWSNREGDGVPVEIMVQLANITRNNPWFSFSNIFDEDYISKFSVYVRDHLDSGLKVYVDSADEPWQKNNSFSANEILLFAKRSGNIFDIWSRTLGGNLTLIRVMKADIDNLEVAKNVLTWCQQNSYCDALSISPFIKLNPTDSARISNMTSDQFIDYLQGTVLSKMKSTIKSHSELAESHNLPLIAYAGGLILGDDKKMEDVFMSVSRNQRMYDLYTDLLNDWREFGGKLFVNVTDIALYTVYDKSASSEYLTQPIENTPKARALYDWAQQNRPWW